MSLPPGIDIWTTPAVQAPAGQTSNLVDPPSLAGAVIGVGTTFMVVAIVATALSISGRMRQLRADDWCRIIGLVISIAYTGVVFALSNTFKPTWDLPLGLLLSPHTNKLDFAESMLLAPAIFFAKLSILLLYFHLFKVSRGTRWGIYGAMLWDFLIYAPSLGLSPYFCAPAPGGSWSDLDKCLRLAIYGPIQGMLAVGLDIYIFVLPIPSVWRLQMATKKKLTFTIVFGTAFMGIVASVVAVVYRFKLYYASQDPNGNSTWYLGALYACILVEDYVAVIVSAMPSSMHALRTFSESRYLRSVSTSFGHLLSSMRPGRSQASRSKMSSKPESSEHQSLPKSPDLESSSGKSFGQEL